MSGLLLVRAAMQTEKSATMPPPGTPGQWASGTEGEPANGTPASRRSASTRRQFRSLLLLQSAKSGEPSPNKVYPSCEVECREGSRHGDQESVAGPGLRKRSLFNYLGRPLPRALSIDNQTRSVFGTLF